MKPLHERIHQLNDEAGWWTNLTTGKSTLETRNRPEMLMLIVSELSEAAEARGPDDKLPEYHGFVVELVDADIRLNDLLGAEQKLHGDIEDYRPDAEDKRPVIREFSQITAGDPYAALMVVVGRVSAALEAYRKGRRAEYLKQLWMIQFVLELVATTFSLADIFDEVREAKLAFNQQRADHKIENRKAEGGKKI